MHVSIVIPARNAAGTLADTLRCLVAQHFSAWEAVVVNDGSTDETADVVRAFAEGDDRIRLVSRPNGGVSRARNAGIHAARHDWLLFLDADDLLLPGHLARLTGRLAVDDSLDAAWCGWACRTQDGFDVGPCPAVQEGDLFARLAVHWLFPIHACVVRRSVVEAVGGFDASLRTSEDWDLWQRVARTGARFGAVPDVLALYRMRPDSASSDARRMRDDSLCVLDRAFGPDARVPHPHPVHPDGLDDALQHARTRWYLAVYAAGLAAGNGDDGAALLDVLDETERVELNPFEVAEWIVQSAVCAAGRPLAAWEDGWRRSRARIGSLLEALEARSGCEGLARRAGVMVELLVHRHTARLSRRHALRARVARLRLAAFHVVPRLRRVLRDGWSLLRRIVRTGFDVVPPLDRAVRDLRRELRFRGRRRHFETFFRSFDDPWDYTNDYEQVKYEQTLALLPPGPVETALELACAEGHFTAQLAPHVDALLATDLSQTAVDRTAERCRGLDNVRVERLDFMRDDPPGRYDLVVCSEVLYFADRKERLAHVAARMADFVKPGGHLVMTHASVVADDPDGPGFHWDHPFGVKTIGETFARVPVLDFVHELQTPLYRVQVFARRAAPVSVTRPAPAVVTKAEMGALPPMVADQVLWNGGAERLPILGYHRIAPDGSAELAPYRVTPEAFEAQLRHLRDRGYRSVDPVDWQNWAQRGYALPRGAVLLTFDDGYDDFYTYAWPLLKQYGFTATVFVVADRIGGTNTWDAGHGERLRLMDWRRLRTLQADGVTFGSHTATHCALGSVPRRAAWYELRRSKAVLERGLGAPVASIAYPWGDCDRTVQFMAGLCGYRFGFTTEPWAATRRPSSFALPRIDIAGTDDLAAFAAKLDEPAPFEATVAV